MTDSNIEKFQFEIELDASSEALVILRNVIIRLASKFNLIENTHQSRVPDTIISLAEEINFGFGCGARKVADLLVVDFLANKRPPIVYAPVLSCLFENLLIAFPNSITISNRNTIPLHPVT